jgi:predicted flap endonuclease-1-like 5' DNA nuclease
MITLALQTFLLLLAAYLAGCMVGCILRRAMYVRQPAVSVPAEVPAVAPLPPARRPPTPESTRFQTALTGKAPAPQPVAPPGEPVVEVRPRPVPEPERYAGSNGTADIEIVKARVEPGPEPIVEAPERQAEPMQENEAPQPVIEQYSAPPVEAAAEPDPPPPPPPPPPPSGAAQMASYAAVAAAAAAARAVSEAEAAARVAEAAPEPEDTDIAEQPIEPGATFGDVSVEEAEPVFVTEDAAIAEPLEPTVAQPIVADDLKRIRSIDRVLEERLNGFGVRRYQDIAAWTSEDVARVSQALGLIGRIEQENWIEQAHILARGSETDFSRRQRVTAASSAAGITAAAASAAASATAQQSAGPDRLTRIIGIDPATEQRLFEMGVSRYFEIAHWTSADVERVEAALQRPGRVGLDNWIEQARVLARYAGQSTDARPVRLADAIRENREPKAADTPAVRPDVAGLRSVRSQALRGEGPAPGDRVDDLKRIRGVGVLIEKRLNGMGITSYEQIANWTKADIDSVSTQLDFRGRIERENWIEQARILASGGQTEFSRRVDRGEVETSKES